MAYLALFLTYLISKNTVTLKNLGQMSLKVIETGTIQ